MKIPLEDLFEDIVGKAQRGLQVSDQDLARRAQLTVEQLRALKQEAGSPDEVPAVAEALGLGPKSLTDSYLRSWYPEEMPDIEGVKQFNSPLMEMTVNAYVVWNPETKDAAVFDTGSDADELLDFIKFAGLTAKYLFLTHTHQDHVADLGAIAKRTHAEIFSPSLERLPETKTVREGDQLRLGKLRIEARLTNGHSPGGTSYIVQGLQNPVAVVGDSLFAGSMGGAPNDYHKALRNNVEKLLSLPGDTLICPGHGPMTTVANEREHNPFFAR
ncbi:MAG TPA: MBL fold metallo-hydrolase [Chthoniobacterales bacterium]|jgi:glyoxylase-like metal-dependent hydrolase (beta-lactamase superfamily II)|nr:MBL fold metallo-hydrolase [Chthoniobacterales bacterium]